MEVKDFLIEMAVTWTTAVEKKTNANWALYSNIQITKHTHMHADTRMYTHTHKYIYTHTKASQELLTLLALTNITTKEQ